MTKALQPEEAILQPEEQNFVSSRLHIVLFEPEIAQNTGNIARTCACIGADLHLVEPMGFRLSDKNMKRAGLDYWDKLNIVRYTCTKDFLEKHEEDTKYFFTGQTTNIFYDYDVSNTEEDVYLIFGRESRGIDPEILEAYADVCVRIPMRETLRSLNLANTVALASYEAMRQRNFIGLI